MEAIIQISRDGKYFVAEDIVSGVADQGSTEQEALNNLQKALEERYHILIDSLSPSQKTVRLDIGVRDAKTSASVS